VEVTITASPSSKSALGCEIDNLDPGLEVTEVVLVLLEPVDSLDMKIFIEDNAPLASYLLDCAFENYPIPPTAEYRASTYF
jgi:hypothetical protein